MLKISSKTYGNGYHSINDDIYYYFVYNFESGENSNSKRDMHHDVNSSTLYNSQDMEAT